MSLRRIRSFDQATDVNPLLPPISGPSLFSLATSVLVLLLLLLSLLSLLHLLMLVLVHFLLASNRRQLVSWWLRMTRCSRQLTARDLVRRWSHWIVWSAGRRSVGHRGQPGTQAWHHLARSHRLSTTVSHIHALSTPSEIKRG